MSDDIELVVSGRKHLCRYFNLDMWKRYIAGWDEAVALALKLKEQQ